MGRLGSESIFQKQKVKTRGCALYAATQGEQVAAPGSSLNFPPQRQEPWRGVKGEQQSVLTQ